MAVSIDKFKLEIKILEYHTTLCRQYHELNYLFKKYHVDLVLKPEINGITPPGGGCTWYREKNEYFIICNTFDLHNK
jgi:hypothetical protein